MFSVSTIERIHARQIFDSRGNPTVEVDMKTDHGEDSNTLLFYT